MSPSESQALAEVLFWFVIVILVVLALDWMACRIHDGLTLTPEEQAASEATRIAKQATKEFKKRQRLRTVKFWNF